MFEEYRQPGPDGRAATLRKTIALAVTLAVHAVLIAWLGTAKITVRIFPDREVRDVVIAPPGVPAYPAQPPEIVGAPAGSEVRPGAAAVDNPVPAGARPAASTGSRRPGAAAGEPGGAVEPETWTSRLARNLDLSLGAGVAGTGGPPGERLRINLAFEPGPLEDAPLRRSGAGGTGSGGPLGYMRPGVPPPSAPRARPGGGGGGGGQTAQVILPPEAYNLGPWAELVINQVQLNWFLPAMRVLPEETEVRIAVTVERDGALSGFEMTSGTSSEALDEAALAAVRNSRPFPALPPDFPLPRLELLFVFKYHG